MSYSGWERMRQQMAAASQQALLRLRHVPARVATAGRVRLAVHCRGRAMPGPNSTAEGAAAEALQLAQAAWPAAAVGVGQQESAATPRMVLLLLLLLGQWTRMTSSAW
jgi:hypothetical protein